MTEPDQGILIASLGKVLQAGLGAVPARLLQTHISYVLLTGQYAYKIKKAVNLGFLDFSTLELRRFYCEEELRLNRRYAPDLYLDVVAIGGTAQAPVLGGPGPAIEYAVRMREFDQETLASRLLARGELMPADIDALAGRLAQFHAACTPTGSEGGPAPARSILQPARDNFSAILQLPGEALDRAEVERLRAWTESEFTRLLPLFRQRQAGGFVRECHGDLHLGNIARIAGELTFFDCIEFSADLRWIDVINETAFLVMDLHAHGRPDYGHRLLNAYLEHTGDYAGLALLRFYVIYRAMVRAKIAVLRARQEGEAQGRNALEEASRYVALATAWTQPARPALILTHGLSGSGKSTVTQGLLQAIGAIRVRSDVERKRQAGLPAQAGSGSQPGAGLYAGAVTEATYRHLLDLARGIVGAGFPAIIDATFLQRAQRDAFRDWAGAHGVPCAILSLQAPEAVLRERIQRRAGAGQDASEATLAVLDRQLASRQELGADELAATVSYDAARPITEARSAALGAALRERLARAMPCPAN